MKTGPKPAMEVCTTELCDYGCGRQAKYKNSKRLMCGSSANSCPVNKGSNSESLKIGYANGTVPSGAERFSKRSEDDKIPWSKGKTAISDNRLGSKSYDEMFCKNSYTAPAHIRSLVIREKLKIYICEGVGCNISETWLDNPISLQLDHVDGDRTNNELINLRWLCPNCHSQTETFCNRKRSVSNRETVSDERLVMALNTEASIRQALLSVGLRADSGNYNRAYKIKASKVLPS